MLVLRCRNWKRNWRHCLWFFFYAVAVPLNPFSLSRYIGRRMMLCQWNQNTRADTPVARILRTDNTVIHMNHFIVGIEKAVAEGDTIGNGRRQGNHFFRHTPCVRSVCVKILQSMWRQPWSTILFHTVVIRFFSGMKGTGSLCVSRATIIRPGTKMQILSISFNSVYGVTLSFCLAKITRPVIEGGVSTWNLNSAMILLSWW